MSRKALLAIPNSIRRYRRYRCLRLRDVAKRLGLLNSAHISSWEKGKKLPTLTSALRLSAILRVPVEVLIYEFFNSLRKEIEAKRPTNTTTK
jgi:transcriptional regulator with XRE-family HTH domain